MIRDAWTRAAAIDAHRAVRRAGDRQDAPGACRRRRTRRRAVGSLLAVRARRVRHVVRGASTSTVSEVPIGVLATLGPDVVSRAGGLLPVDRRSAADRPRPTRRGRRARGDARRARRKSSSSIGRDRTIVLDDIQWAGPTSSAFVGRLLSSTSGTATAGDLAPPGSGRRRRGRDTDAVRGPPVRRGASVSCCASAAWPTATSPRSPGGPAAIPCSRCSPQAAQLARDATHLPTPSCRCRPASWRCSVSPVCSVEPSTSCSSAS